VGSAFKRNGANLHIPKPLKEQDMQQTPNYGALSAHLTAKVCVTIFYCFIIFFFGFALFQILMIKSNFFRQDSLCCTISNTRI